MLVIGHRGASAAFGDNTLPAFRGAVAQGADGVELDVRRTADGALALVHHDALPDGRLVADTPAAELPGEVIQLHQALSVCEPLALVNVEIKNWPEDRDFDPEDRVAAQIVRLLAERGELDDPRLLVSAFHLATVGRVRELAPTLRTAWLLGTFEDAATVIDRAAEHGHVAIHPHHLFVDEAFVERAHAAGLAVNTWTCDEPDRIRWLAEIGVDAVMTNTPDVALRALGR